MAATEVEDRAGQPPAGGGRPRVSDIAARLVAERILSEELTEGVRLPSEADLAAGLGVSRASVREALRLLESWGLVQVRPGRGQGATVRRPGISDTTRSLALVLNGRGVSLHDIAHARLAIESTCLRLAAARGDRPRLRLLLRSVAACESGLEPWPEHTVRFHTGIAAATGNPVLEAVVTSLGGLIRFSASVAVISTQSRALTLRAHRRIAEALLLGDADRAERRLRAHMLAFADLVTTGYQLNASLLTGQPPIGAEFEVQN